ncbi:MAG TPA: TonB-dependent receptor [Flavobacteriales bacterium]|nr:TonB-dependent receptor [Flavobacteriales bacterium]
MQAQTISGNVYSASDSTAIPGVNVTVSGTYSGTFTNADGKFDIRYGKADSVKLDLTFIGFNNREIAVVAGQDKLYNVYLTPTSYEKDAVVVNATRANRNTATAYTDVDLETIERRNFGQDIPVLLELEPSVVSTSDAGAGVGYTGIRIRGTDPTRINVTLNGIPINDSESHGVFWVNMPDLASSLDNIQVQRGVGTSSNGSAAFGGSINMQTNKFRKKWYVETTNGYGSFNTWRHSVSAGSGLIANKFTVDARFSRISSDGYVDRATSSLWSWYASAAYHGKKTMLRFNVLGGRERTYQSWYGTPESRINGNQEEMQAFIDRNFLSEPDANNLLNSGRTYNFYTYENQVDNYGQDHYQLIFAHEFDRNWNININGHYTRGKGYFEQFRGEDDLADYGLENVIAGTDTITTADLVRRRWLDNHFYGATFSMNYTGKKVQATLGGGWNNYIGDHFGEVIQTEFTEYEELQERYYFDAARKTDISVYLRANYQVHSKVNLFADLQLRSIDYSFEGPEADIFGRVSIIQQRLNWLFFNPKAGINYELNSSNRIYSSIAVGNREPARVDIVDATQVSRPESERMYDWELGYERKHRIYSFGVNAYWMIYQNQLVLSGRVNDVGAYIRENVDQSYRLGVEVMTSINILKNLSLNANFTWSRNRILNFAEYVDDYDNGGQQVIEHGETEISFSPNYVANAVLTYRPIKNLDIAFITQYVGEQFLDNTSNRDRMLNDYVTNNFRVHYNNKWKFFKEIGVGVQLNNIFNQLYESNGYTFSYIAGGESITENFYYPQAGFNFMTMLTLKF